MNAKDKSKFLKIFDGHVNLYNNNSALSKLENTQRIPMPKKEITDETPKP
jgi:hypothetical protein